jgi:hypothetical protein
VLAQDRPIELDHAVTPETFDKVAAEEITRQIAMWKSHDFRQEFAKAMKVPMDFIGDRMGRLMLGKKPILHVPCIIDD